MEQNENAKQRAPFDRRRFIRRIFTKEEIGQVARGEASSFAEDGLVVPIPMRFGGPLRLLKITESFSGMKCAMAIWGTSFAVANNEVYLFGELDSDLYIGGLSRSDFQTA